MAKKILVDMAGLMELIADRIARGAEGDLHREVCRVAADQYELWDDEDRFPVWLSRIVEGEMRDAGL